MSLGLCYFIQMDCIPWIQNATVNVTYKLVKLVVHEQKMTNNSSTKKLTYHEHQKYIEMYSPRSRNLHNQVYHQVAIEK